VQTYTPEKTRTYETLIKDSAIEAMGASEPLETPVSLYLYIRVPIPKSCTKKRLEAIDNGSEKPTKKPDASNILKSVEDGMNGVVYHDDSQIINIHVTKVYSSLPGADICVKECLE
jgi:Holliday junction resolvase RusA-like endonuclease